MGTDQRHQSCHCGDHQYPDHIAHHPEYPGQHLFQARDSGSGWRWRRDWNPREIAPALEGKIGERYALNDASIHAGSLLRLEVTVPTAYDVPLHHGAIAQVDVPARDDQVPLDGALHVGAPVPDDGGAFDAAIGLQGHVAVEDDQVTVQPLVLAQCVVLVPDDGTIVARRVAVCQCWRDW